MSTCLRTYASITISLILGEILLFPTTAAADVLGYTLDTSGGSQHVDTRPPPPTSPGPTGDFFARQLMLTSAVDVTSVSVEGLVSPSSPFTLWLVSGLVGNGTPASVLESATFGCCEGPTALSLSNSLLLSPGAYYIVVSGSGSCCGTREYDANPLDLLPTPSWGTFGPGLVCTEDVSGNCDNAFPPGGSWEPQVSGVGNQVLAFQVQGTPVTSSVPEPNSIILLLSGGLVGWRVMAQPQVGRPPVL